MKSDQKKKSQNRIKGTNVLETLKQDVGGSVVNSIQEDLLRKMPGDVFEQLFGPQSQNRHGEIVAGESIEMQDVFTGRAEENEKVQKQLHFERNLREELRVEKDNKINELRMELNAVMQEVVFLMEQTQELGEETQIAAMQAPIEPGIYHVIFFQKLLEFIKSFRKKVEEASVWLHSVNKRAQKKNYWSQYKKSGSKFLLSGEHYVTRSAG